MACRLLARALAVGWLVAAVSIGPVWAQSDPSALDPAADTGLTDTDAEADPPASAAPAAVVAPAQSLRDQLLQAEAERWAVVDIVRALPNPLGGAFHPAVVPKVGPPLVMVVLRLDWREPASLQWASLPVDVRYTYAERLAAALKQSFPDRSVTVHILAFDASLRPVITAAQR